MSPIPAPIESEGAKMPGGIFDHRQASPLDRARVQREQAVAGARAIARAVASGVCPAFQRRRRRTEDDRNSALAGTEHGQVARRVLTGAVVCASPMR